MSYRQTIHKALTWGTIGANVVVFTKWNIHLPPRDPTTNKYYEAHHPISIQSHLNHARYMEDHYTLSKRNIDQGRWYTMLTSALSHHSLVHLLFNMFVFKTAADVAGFIGMGPLRFISLGVGSALGGSVGSLWYDALYPRQSGGQDVPSLGASGMVQGMLVATMLAVPHIPMSIMFIPVEISYRTAVLGFLAWDMYNLHSEMTSGTRRKHSNILSIGNDKSSGATTSHDTSREDSRFDDTSTNFNEFASDDFSGSKSGSNVMSDNNTNGNSGAEGGDGFFVGYAAHLGGAAFGALFYVFFLRRSIRRVVSIFPPPAPTSNASFGPRQMGARGQPVTKSSSSSSNSKSSSNSNSSSSSSSKTNNNNSNNNNNNNKASASPKKLPKIKRRP